MLKSDLGRDLLHRTVLNGTYARTEDRSKCSKNPTQARLFVHESEIRSKFLPSQQGVMRPKWRVRVLLRGESKMFHLGGRMLDLSPLALLEFALEKF